ncbi:hypothetical protein HGA64_04630, partial [Candidatus Falkowbacteria bacterium]|nr:hypothetical protein [Candidatus Falkowbacteria bacterium]
MGEVYLAQPDSHKEGLAGRLFIIIELPSDAPGGAKFINYLVNELNHNYYQNEKLILRERLSTIKIEHIFEAALAKTNKNIADFLQNPAITLNLREINATVGVIFENELHFTTLGKNKAFLVYLNPKTEVSSYKITEISQRFEADYTPLQPNKLFSNVINGELPQGGYFIFTNEALPEYITGKQLTEIVTTLSPASAVEQIKLQLSRVNSFVSFLGLVIKNTVGQREPQADRVVLVGSGQTSINTLKSTEEATERLLTPSGIIDVKTWLGKALSRYSDKSSGKPAQLSLTSKVTGRKAIKLVWLKKLGQSFFTVVGAVAQVAM